MSTENTEIVCNEKILTTTKGTFVLEILTNENDFWKNFVVVNLLQ